MELDPHSAPHEPQESIGFAPISLVWHLFPDKIDASGPPLRSRHEPCSTKMRLSSVDERFVAKPRSLAALAQAGVVR
jgi:hypothetical protein